MNTLRQGFVLLLYAVIVGFGINYFSPAGLEFIGEYRDLADTEGLEAIIPPSATPGDPPFISYHDAVNMYQSGDVLFVDAREPAEYDCGTIPGAVNLSFDLLPEQNMMNYIDSVLLGSPKTRKLVTFCSGDECDVSLHLARNLKDFGYSGVSIFFGGAREWEKFGQKMERRTECGN